MDDLLDGVAVPLPPVDRAAATEAEEAEDVAPQNDDALFINGEPRLRGGYILRIAVTVGERAEVNPLEVQISERNEITLPLLGKVDCEGLTIDGLRSHLATRYSEFFRSPEVTASFVVRDPSTSPWGRVYVGGRVQREGPVYIPATRRLMVSDAIVAAGGFAQFANRSDIRVSRRRADNTIETFKVDIDEMNKRGKTENDMLLKSGDTVYVKTNSF